ncbi:putative N6-adenosine-methyltransferase 70 kDa subunit [Neospora caninum Liverpool]|uniref:Putative N6-adenosine-methyltransferase 70 kDa subunit n=1 Tax=Neospora caninum (strain Liverpool) TaxID=572307 RepID=F0VPY8_NEOCL|nr:putative N6-adenosine-methyltransferase 70 kDa subunit [Neospora caninum Liverpool]CBZ55785.1 putative N6-adenosine-methyltransferase 70 kDa subunit [Neospora caninum Liverpool]|eukprot:XP_003885811.1 putative N6-adenosine-methyltransferase 70 kDa subunit [Neospora caninum Liverpool]
MSSHLRQRFQQRKLGLAGTGLAPSLAGTAPPSGPSTNVVAPPLASLSRSTSGPTVPGVSGQPGPPEAQPSAPGLAAAAARPGAESDRGAWGERGASRRDEQRDDRHGADRWPSEKRPGAAGPAGAVSYGNTPDGRGPLGPSRDVRGRDTEGDREGFYSHAARPASFPRRPFEESSRGPPRGAEFRQPLAGLHDPRRQEEGLALHAPAESAQLVKNASDPPFSGPGALATARAPHGGAGPAHQPQGGDVRGAVETGVSPRAPGRPMAALPPLPQDLPLDHPSLAFSQGAKVPSSMEELLPFILRALLHHPSVSPAIRRPETAPGPETVTCLARSAECHIELNAFAAHLKQASRATGFAAGRVSSLASQRLFRPEAVLRVLQFAAFRAEAADGESGDASAAPVLGALHPFPYPLLALASINSLTVIKTVFPLRICAVLFMLFQQSQQQAVASASPPTAGAAPQHSVETGPRPGAAVEGPPPRAVPAAGPPFSGPQTLPSVSLPPQGPPHAPPPPPPPPPGFARPPFFSGGPPTALGANVGGAPLGTPGGPPPPPPACEGDKKTGPGGDKGADAELQDLEKLLSVPTALKQRDLDSGSELTSLLSAPTARQQMIIHSFKNKGGSALREICTYGSRVECCRARNSFKPCSKVHFRRIILPHTDVSLGDCSYLDTCRHIETCRYVHYEVDDASKNDALKKMRGEMAADPYAIGTISAGAYTEYPAQWIRCDIRTFDFSIFRKLIRVVMADPPWDIHMDLPYGTMTDQEMRSLRVDLIQEEGLLFLWVTGRAMELARECLQLWGYRRVEEILWVKTNQLQRIIRTGRTGHWLNHSKEHCLVAVKGNVPFNRNIDCDVIVSERMAPDSLKVELFGRMHNVRNNWITLGNQLKGVKIEHPLLRDRYNAFAEREGLPLADIPSASGVESENRDASAEEKNEETSAVDGEA